MSWFQLGTVRDIWDTSRDCAVESAVKVVGRSRRHRFFRPSGTNKSSPHRSRAATQGGMTRTTVICGLVLAVLHVASGQRAVAAQFDVTVTSDSGDGSLRKALLDASTAPGDDDVVVQAGLGTITVASELA